MQVEIDDQGNVSSAEAISGNEILFESSVSAAKKAKFTHSPLPPGRMNGIIVYNFDSYVRCLDVGIINDKAKILPMPKSQTVYPKNKWEILVDVIINLQTGKVVSATAEEGQILLRNPAIKAALNAEFEPILKEFPDVFGI